MKRLSILGNLGRDPELKFDENGKLFATFSVAVGQSKDEEKSKTEYIEVSCSGRMADIALTSAAKGSTVFIEGYPVVKASINNITQQPVGIQRLYAHYIYVIPRSMVNSAEL